MLKHNKKMKYFCNIKFLRPAALAGYVAAVDGFFACFNVDAVAGLHLGDGAAGVVVKFAGVSISDVGEGGGADQDQDGGKCEYAFHRRGSFRFGLKKSGIIYFRL